MRNREPQAFGGGSCLAWRRAPREWVKLPCARSSGDPLPWHPQALGELGHSHRELQCCSVNTEGRGCECVGALEPTTGRHRKGLGEKGGARLGGNAQRDS